MNEARPDEGVSLAEHLLAWLDREAPDFLADLATAWGQPGPAVMIYLLSDRSLLPAENYIERFGRSLITDTLALLRRWVDDLAAGHDELRWLPADPAADWTPLATAQLRRLRPAAPLDDRQAVALWRAALRDIYEGAVEIGGARCAVAVFPRPEAPPAAADDPPPEPITDPAPAAPAERDALQAAYDARVTPEHAPTTEEDRDWARDMGITQDRVAALRRDNPDPRLHARHRRG